MFYIFYLVIYSIRDDVKKKHDHEIQLKMLVIEQCAKDYKIHQCNAVIRLPALEQYCIDKEQCLNQDPIRDVHSSKMTATIVATIINEFIERLGIKTLVFLCVIFFGYSPLY